MPGPLLPAGIAAGASLLGAGANAYAQGKMNAKTIAYNERMYGKQRQDTLFDWNMQNHYNEQWWHNQNKRDDEIWARDNAYMEGLWNKQNKYNEDMWHQMNAREDMIWQRENEYNSPTAQMQRYKDAGLNPNLIYGQSNTAGSMSTAPMQSADFNPAQSKSSDKASNSKDGVGVLPYNPKAPQFDVQSGINAYLDVKQRTAQTNNLEAQNKVLEQDALLRQVQTTKELAQTDNIAAGTARSQYDLQQLRDTRQISIDALNESLRKLKIENQISISQEERAKAMHQPTLMKAAEEILNLRGQTMNNELERQLKMMDLQMRQYGISPGSGDWLNSLGRIIAVWGQKGYNYLEGISK